MSVQTTFWFQISAVKLKILINLIPPVQFIGLTISVVTENLNIVEHLFDDFFVDPLELSFDLVTVILGVFRMKMINTFSFFLNPSLDVIQLGICNFGFLMYFFSQFLEFF